jgi:hypothetical protein
MTVYRGENGKLHIDQSVEPTSGEGAAPVAVNFPTYAEVLIHAAVRAVVELGLPLSGQAEHVAPSPGR